MLQPNAFNEFDHQTKIWIKNILDEHREYFGSPPKTTLSRPQAEALWRLLPQLFRSWHPTTIPMAQHAPLVNFLSRLNTDVGAGTDKEFLTTTGRRLAAAQILLEEDFGKQGQ